MRKDLGKKSWLFPMPVFIIGTYDENGVPDAMNAAWGGMFDYNQVTVSLGSHVSTDNIRKIKAFTISLVPDNIKPKSTNICIYVITVFTYVTVPYVSVDNTLVK